MKELGLPTDTWAVIFDPKYLAKVKGRVTVLDSSNELFAAALKYLGYSANDTDEKHWKEAADLIKKAKPYWAAFNASSYIKELTVGNIWLVHGYSNDIFQANQDAQAAGRKFQILQGMPKEGAVLAVDNMVIHKDAPRPDLALQVHQLHARRQELGGAHQPDRLGQSERSMPRKYIKPELKALPAVFPPKDVQAKLEQLQDLTPAQRRLRNRMWTEIKAGKYDQSRRPTPGRCSGTKATSVEREARSHGSLRVERLTPARGARLPALLRSRARAGVRRQSGVGGPATATSTRCRRALNWSDFDGPMNRIAMAARIAAGEMEGLSRLRGDEVVGWMNAQPYHKLRFACARMRIAAPAAAVPPHEAAAIVCFVIAPARRRQGVATRAARRRARRPRRARHRARRRVPVEGRRRTTPRPTDHYHGTLSMFIAAGFAPSPTHENVTVVRKTLK